jgi:peptidoglycan/LPS O-acetylase OafA/YrhL
MRLKHIDALRGIAALMVTIFHLSGSSGLSKQTASFGKYGYLGVEIFFVISGFVLPYSLFKSGYKLKNFFTFILKRIIRISPAYIVIILISMVLAAVTGREIISLPRFALHLVFLNSFFGYQDISAVFWTLKIEFGFYILIGLLFTHFFTSNYKSLLLIAVAIVLALFNTLGFPLLWVSYFAFPLLWMPYFALGILIFNRRFTNMNSFAFWSMSGVLILVNFKMHGFAETFAGCFAYFFILFVKIENFGKIIGRFLLWLGMISYSLYLVHWELGRSAVSVCRHIPGMGNLEMLRLTIGVGFSLICGYLLYKFVEKPSIKLANKIDYKR